MCGASDESNRKRNQTFQTWTKKKNAIFKEGRSKDFPSKIVISAHTHTRNLERNYCVNPFRRKKLPCLRAVSCTFVQKPTCQRLSSACQEAGGAFVFAAQLGLFGLSLEEKNTSRQSNDFGASPAGADRQQQQQVLFV